MSEYVLKYVGFSNPVYWCVVGGWVSVIHLASVFLDEEIAQAWAERSILPYPGVAVEEVSGLLQTQENDDRDSKHCRICGDFNKYSLGAQEAHIIASGVDRDDKAWSHGFTICGSCIDTGSANDIRSLLGSSRRPVTYAPQNKGVEG